MKHTFSRENLIATNRNTDKSTDNQSTDKSS